MKDSFVQKSWLLDVSTDVSLAQFDSVLQSEPTELQCKLEG